MKICVFCGSNFGRRSDYEKEARALGRAIAEAGHGTVFGGAQDGLMGVVADSALDAGGEVIGVLPEKNLEGNTDLLMALHGIERPPQAYFDIRPMISNMITE